ncbi:MAG: molybdopterin molybdotransferase MoeA [Magnetococcales bacterium]|nr:molybdopterin molybdotransferase MoeA [Magnetococcales bacterium]
MDKGLEKKEGLLAFDTAQQRILDGIHAVTDTESIELDHLSGRILAADVTAMIHVPNHDNSAMDGYAVNSTDLVGTGEVLLRVAGDLAAGGCYPARLNPGEAVRIMTGAPIPQGADAVVMQETCRREQNGVRVPCGIPSGSHIRLAGEDMRMGDTILHQGRRLRPVDIGVLAAQGITAARVFRRPRVAVLSTGNEVVEVGRPLAPGQVYNSNRAGLKAALTRLGCTVVDYGIVQDTLPAIEEALNRAGREADAVISTGGVSVGDYDLVRLALEKHGTIDFWKVAIKPGKPLAYGRLAAATFFGLPGNPVSALTIYYVLIRPALLRLMGGHAQPRKMFRARFKGHFAKKHGRKEFLRAVVDLTTDPIEVATTGPQGSGVLTSLSLANAFIVVPEGQVTLSTGDWVRIWMIDDD